MSADLQRIIRIVFKGDNETQRAFSQLTSQLNALEGGVRSVTGPMADLADDILKAQAAATTLATGGMALAVQQASSWEQSFNEISTLITETGVDLDAFNRQVRDYAFNSTASLEDIQGALYSAISLGIDWRDALGAMAQAEKLATATNGELKESLRLVAQTMNAYGAESDEAARYTDVFVAAIQQGDLTIDSMAANLSKVSGVASSAGVPIEQVAAALAALTAQGEPAERASTALARAIQDILTPTPQAQKAFEELGIEFGKSALEAKGLDGVLLDILKSTGGNVEEIDRLFGSSVGMNGVLKLIATDGGKKMIEAMEAMRNSSGATESAFLKMADNMTQHVQTLINRMRILFVEGGIPILDEFKGSVGVLSDVLAGIRIAADDGAFSPLLRQFEGLLKDVNAYGKGIADALPEALGKVNWDKLREGYGKLGETIANLLKTLFQDLDPRKPDELGKILQTLADVLGNLAAVSASILKEWQPLMKFTGEFAVEMGKMDKATAESIGSMLGQAQRMEFLWEQFGFVKGSLIELALQSGLTAKEFIAAFEVIQGAAKVLLNGVQVAVGGVALVISDILGFIVKSFNTVTFGKIEWATDLENELTTVREDILQGLIRDGQDARDGLGLIGRGLGTLTGAARDAAGEVAGLSGNLSELNETDAKAKVEIEWDEDFGGWDHEFWDKVDKEHEIKVKTEIDLAKLESTREILGTITDQYGNTKLIYGPEVDPAALKETEKTVDQLLKEREIDIQFDIANIKANAEIVQSAIEWKAHVDMAQAQADMERFRSVMEATSATLQSTGDLIGSLFGQFTDADRFDRSYIMDQINMENEMRKEAFELQKQLSLEQIETMRARREAMERGDAMITINGEGLQSHLEAFMWEILAAIQTRVNEEGLDMLMGTEGA